MIASTIGADEVAGMSCGRRTIIGPGGGDIGGGDMAAACHCWEGEWDGEWPPGYGPDG